MGGGLAGAMVVVGRGVLFGANFDFLTVVLKLFGHCFLKLRFFNEIWAILSKSVPVI